MSDNSKHIMQEYIKFCDSAQDGDFHKEPVSSGAYTAPLQILFSKAEGSVSATVQFFGNVDPVTNERAIHGTEDLTSVFADARNFDGDVSINLNNLSAAWYEIYGEIEHDRKLSTGELRDDNGKNSIDSQVREMKANSVSEFVRLSPIDGVSTKLRFVQGDDETKDPKVTLHYQRNGKSGKDMYDPVVSCNEEFEIMGMDRFLGWVEGIHDSWIRDEFKRREAMATEKSARKGRTSSQGKTSLRVRSTAGEPSVHL